MAGKTAEMFKCLTETRFDWFTNKSQ